MLFEDDYAISRSIEIPFKRGLYNAYNEMRKRNSDDFSLKEEKIKDEIFQIKKRISKISLYKMTEDDYLDECKKIKEYIDFLRNEIGIHRDNGYILEVNHLVKRF